MPSSEEWERRLLTAGMGSNGPYPQLVLNEDIVESLQVTPDCIEREWRAQFQVIEDRTDEEVIELLQRQ